MNRQIIYTKTKKQKGGDIGVFSFSPDNQALPIMTIVSISDSLNNYRKEILNYHTHDFYLIAWTTKGSCKCCAKSKEYVLKENCLFFLSPGQACSCELVNADNVIEGVFIAFSPHFFDYLSPKSVQTLKYELMHKTDLLAIQGDAISYLNNLLKEMQGVILGEQSIIQSQALLSNLTLFLCKIVECFNLPMSPQGSIRQVQLFDKYIKLINLHHTRIRNVKAYAKQLCVSHRTLMNATNAVTGNPPLYFIQQKITSEAKQLLLHSNLNIAEIAVSLGFNDESNFSKYFQRVEGMQPSMFREMYV